MKVKKMLLEISKIVTLVFIFLISLNFSLFLGLQVHPMLGNIGMVLSLVLLVLLIVFFVRKKK